MKYKVGDEVLVKAKIIEVKEDENTSYKVKRYGNPVPDNFASSICVGESDIVPQKDMTADEAWEISRKIIYDASDCGMSIDDLRNVFGISNCQGVLSNFTPQQAKAKIEAWEAEKEIKVGDEVKVKNDQGQYTDKAVVTRTWEDACVNIMYDDGTTGISMKRDIKKTGRHIDIEGILKQIGVDE